MKRLNAIVEQLGKLDVAAAPGFVINGLKREQLIAQNSMLLYELFFESLDDSSEPDARMREALARDFGSIDDGVPNSPRWSKPSAAARAGCC